MLDIPHILKTSVHHMLWNCANSLSGAPKNGTLKYEASVI